MVVMHQDHRTKEYYDCEGAMMYKLAHMGMMNGGVYSLMVSFKRWRAYLTKPKHSRLIKELDAKLEPGKYPRELIVQAINMAPECTFDQSLSNLTTNAARVFEAILMADDRKILSKVKAVREHANYPSIRAKYKILGEPYRERILQ